MDIEIKEKSTERIKYLAPMVELSHFSSLSLLKSFSSKVVLKDYIDEGEWGVDELGNLLEEI